MSVSLKEDIQKVPQSPWGLVQADLRWYWGKAAKDGENYKVVGHFATCKDYLVDMQYRTTHLGTLSNWTKKEWSSNCYYIIMPSKKVYDRFTKNVTEVLNVYEKKHKLKKTIVTVVDEPPEGANRVVVIIEGSNMWTRNTCALSFYLSLIRLCGYVQMSVDTLEQVMEENYKLCNETSYFSTLTKEYKEVYNYFYQNPRELLIHPGETCNITCWNKKAGDIGHGASGLFYLMSSYRVINKNKYQTETRIKDNPIYIKIKAFLTRDNNVQV